MKESNIILAARRAAVLAMTDQPRMPWSGVPGENLSLDTALWVGGWIHQASGRLMDAQDVRPMIDAAVRETLIQIGYRAEE